MDMMDFFDDYMLEYFNDVLMEATRTYPAYAQAEQDETESEKPIIGLLLDDETGVQKYVNCIGAVTTMEWRILYEQGWKDCAAMLKQINLL